MTKVLLICCGLVMVSATLAGHRWNYSSWLFTGTRLLSEVAGLDDLPGEYERKAEATRQSIFATCWNPEIGFFTTARTDSSYPC